MLDAQALTLPVVPGASEPVETTAFCSHCGAHADPAELDAPSRVCASCSLGLLLEAQTSLAPQPDDAFIVVDCALSVCAVSRAAERLLATSEIDAVNRHLTELVVPADAESQGAENLAVAATWAARGDCGEQRVMVRPTNTFGVRTTARIGTCGPPRAALVVFE